MAFSYTETHAPRVPPCLFLPPPPTLDGVDTRTYLDKQSSLLAFT